MNVGNLSPRAKLLIFTVSITLLLFLFWVLLSCRLQICYYIVSLGMLALLLTIISWSIIARIRKGNPRSKEKGRKSAHHDSAGELEADWDYSPERLKRIYDKVGLRILN